MRAANPTRKNTIPEGFQLVEQALGDSRPELDGADRQHHESRWRNGTRRFVQTAPTDEQGVFYLGRLRDLLKALV